MMREVGGAAYARQTRAVVSRPDMRGWLTDLRCPVALIGGADDPVVPAKLTQELAASMPQSTLTTIAACGHVSVMEQPAQVNQALLAWWMRMTRNAP
jgi:pimeloyl-ACP methyl ester carboxylesterase